jgi:hypothetical protein
MIRKENLPSDIAKKKQKLIRIYKQKGLYENFGQKEVRALEDKYGQFMYDELKDGRSVINLIMSFNEWCMTFNGEE